LRAGCARGAHAGMDGVGRGHRDRVGRLPAGHVGARMTRPTRRWMLGALPALGCALAAFAQQAGLRIGKDVAAPAEAGEDYAVQSWIDIYGRPTVQVTINGQGPFQFMVDTGSATTVIAARHVETLQATSRGKVMVNGATGSAIMPLVELESLQAGAVDKK